MEAINIGNRLSLTVNRKLHVVVLTGAGISIESGVPIFRGKGSMWENPEAKKLAKKGRPPWNTKESWEFYEWRRKLVSRCKPNSAHYTLVEMEKYFENFSLITQNVDGLHARAGSRNILELHGNMWKGRCIECGSIIELLDTPLKSLPPQCTCGYNLRPHIVQFGESLDSNILNKSLKTSREAELFFVIGTSGVVSPAAQMPLIALENKARVIEINPTPTPLTPYMTSSIQGKAGEVLPKIWRELISLSQNQKYSKSSNVDQFG